MKTLILLFPLALLLTACASQDNTAAKDIPTDNPSYAVLQQAMNRNQDTFTAQHPKGHISHRAIIHYFAPGGHDEIELELDAGKAYFIFSACDLNCHDIDISIRENNPQHTLLAQNTRVDKTTLLQYTPEHDGTYNMKIQMENCNADKCYYSVQVMTDPESVTPKP